jgi:uncharacterized protein
VNSITLPVISALTAGILIVMQMILMVAVARSRQENRQALSYGDHPSLLRAIRRHGNFAENSAIFIACFTLLELLGANRPGLEIACAVFVAGRLIHAIGLSFSKTVNIFRGLGAVSTALIGIVVGVWLVLMAFSLIPAI